MGKPFRQTKESPSIFRSISKTWHAHVREEIALAMRIQPLFTNTFARAYFKILFSIQEYSQFFLYNVIKLGVGVFSLKTT